MPFSIKRLTSLHRSHSLQSPAQGKTDSGKNIQPDQCNSNQQQHSQPPLPPPHQSSAKNLKSMKQSKSKSKHKNNNAETDAICSSKTSATPNNYVADMTAASVAQRTKSPPPPPLPAHQSSGRNVPPSFVICNQTTIPFQPQQQQQQQQQHHHKSNTSRYQDDAAAAVDEDCSPAAMAGSIPNSRSLDAHEIRRLTGNQSIASNQPPSYAHSQTLRNWNKTGDNQIQQRQSSAVLSDGEDIATPETVSKPVTKPPSAGKRVHYAAQTFTRASSMSGHIPAGYPNVNSGSNSLDDPRVSSKPRSMMLQRQVSTTNPPPLPSQAKPTSSSSATSILKNSSNQGLSSSQAANGLGYSSTGTGANSAVCGPLMGLPRGGEEVLINGGGHPRSRSSKSPSASSSSRHYAKHLHTSSSIDVVLPDSSSNNSNNNTATNLDWISGNNTSNNQSTKLTSASANKMDEHSSRNNNRTNSSSQKTGSAAAGAESTKKSESNNHNSTESSKPHRSSKSANQTLSNTSHNANRSASTTPLDRNFYNFQTNQSSLFDDDPGIMSEIETSATGFRRGNKVRSSLPIVRTPSKSQDRSLGLVFLQFRTETKRALLPNEITSIDTVKALFVRSFPRQLSMEYLDHPSARIYIHDPSKDMFYELEDLRDVKDRCILRIYEQGVNGPQPGGSGLPIPYTGGGGGNAAPDVENYGYFSEPEFDSEYQSQHIHRKRFPSPIVGQSLMVGTNPVSQSQYYGTILLPPQYRPANLGPRQPFLPNQNLPGQPPQPPARNKQYSGYSQTLPRGTHLMSPTAISAINNPFAMIGAGQQPPPKPQRSFNNAQGGLIMIQGIPPRPSPLNGPMPPNPAIVPQPIAYHQNRPLPDRPYSVAGHYPPDRNGPSPRVPYPPGSVPNNQEFSGYLSSPEHRPSAAMLALHSGQPHPRASFSGFPSSTRPFEAEMAGSTAAPVAYPPAYGARHATNPAMDDESRVRMHEMERQIASLTNVVSKALGGSKPAPPPKPASLVGHRSELNANLPTDSLTQLRQIRRRARDLRSDIRSLKRLALQQTSNTKEILQETCNKMKSALMFLSASDVQLRLERLRISTERDSYNEDASRLDKDLLELEAKVEELRSNVINRRCRVNMSNVESMALILSRASKTVADLKARYPSMAQILKKIMTQELQQIEKEEKFFKEEPDRLEHSLKRCKKLTGTLVTLKRLASVQEQRSSTNPNTSSPSQLFDKKDGSGDETSSPGNNGPTSGGSGSNRDTYMSRSYDTDLMAPPHTIIQVTPATPSSTDSSSKNSSNVLENLLDELQTFSKQSSIDSPSSSTGTVMQRSSGSLRGSSSRSSNVPFDNPNSDTIARKGDNDELILSRSRERNSTTTTTINTTSSDYDLSNNCDEIRSRKIDNILQNCAAINFPKESEI